MLVCVLLCTYTCLEQRTPNRSGAGFKRRFAISGLWPLVLFPYGRALAFESDANFANRAGGILVMRCMDAVANGVFQSTFRMSWLRMWKALSRTAASFRDS